MTRKKQIRSESTITIIENMSTTTTSSSSIMPSSKKAKKKRKSIHKRPLEHVAPLYLEDIGTAGIKKPRTSPSLIGSQQQQRVVLHELRMDDDEEYRRKLREVRKEGLEWKEMHDLIYSLLERVCVTFFLRY